MPSRTNKLRKNPTSEGKRAVFESLKSPQNVESILLSDKLNNSQIFFQIKDECKKYDIPLIEDAAEMIGHDMVRVLAEVA